VTITKKPAFSSKNVLRSKAIKERRRFDKKMEKKRMRGRDRDDGKNGKRVVKSLEKPARQDDAERRGAAFQRPLEPGREKKGGVAREILCEEGKVQEKNDEKNRKDRIVVRTLTNTRITI